MKLSTKSFLNLESLEERLTPAFDFLYNPTSDIWTVTQVQDDADITIEVDGSNDLVITDGGGGPVTVGVAGGSLTINLMDNSSGDLTVELDGLLFGNVSINLGNGGDFDGDAIRDLSLTTMGGTGIFIGGNLSITGGTGEQSVTFDDALGVGGSMNIDLGLGDDSVSAASATSIGSNVSFRGVNDWDAPAAVTVGGSFSMAVNMETETNTFDASVTGATVIGGNLTYIGGNSDDDIFLDVGVVIGGNVNINLGNDISGGTQEVRLDNFGGAAIIGGNVTIRGGTISGNDSIISDADTIVGGNIYINTNNLGDDVVTLLGTVGGRSVSVITGLGDDVVTYGMTGNRPRVYANLFLGDDTFILGDNVSNPSLSFLYVDFGFGTDIFTNNFMGPFTFRAYLRNLP